MLILGTSQEIWWLKLCLLVQGIRVQFLVGELKSHMTGGKKSKLYKNRSNIVTNSVQILKTRAC